MLFVICYLHLLFLVPSKNKLTMLYYPPRWSGMTLHAKICPCPADDITASNYFLKASKKFANNIRLEVNCIPNLSNAVIVVVAECYPQNLSISVEFDWAHSLTVRLFCHPRANLWVGVGASVGPSESSNIGSLST